MKKEISCLLIIDNFKKDSTFGCQTCANTAWFKDLELLKWLRDQALEWDETTCEYAAERLNIDILKWARLTLGSRDVSSSSDRV